MASSSGSPPAPAAPEVVTIHPSPSVVSSHSTSDPSSTSPSSTKPPAAVESSFIESVVNEFHQPNATLKSAAAFALLTMILASADLISLYVDSRKSSSPVDSNAWSADIAILCASFLDLLLTLNGIVRPSKFNESVTQKLSSVLFTILSASGIMVRLQAQADSAPIIACIMSTLGKGGATGLFHWLLAPLSNNNNSNNEEKRDGHSSDRGRQPDAEIIPDEYVPDSSIEMTSPGSSSFHSIPLYAPPQQPGVGDIEVHAALVEPLRKNAYVVSFVADHFNQVYMNEFHGGKQLHFIVEFEAMVKPGEAYQRSTTCLIDLSRREQFVKPVDDRPVGFLCSPVPLHPTQLGMSVWFIVPSIFSFDTLFRIKVTAYAGQHTNIICQYLTPAPIKINEEQNH